MMKSYKDTMRNFLMTSSYRDTRRESLSLSYNLNSKVNPSKDSYTNCKAKSFMTGGPRADERRCCSYDD